ncbi:hypothetical protein LINGRAHAP2_LOCUS24955 [Linum grandiflorum]
MWLLLLVNVRDMHVLVWNSTSLSLFWESMNLIT